MKKNIGSKLMASAIALGTVSSIIGTGTVKADDVLVQDHAREPGYYQENKTETGNGTVAKDPTKGPGYYPSYGVKADPMTGIVKIKYVPGYGVALWNSPLNGKTIPGRFLAHGTNWKVTGVTKVNGETWYQVGTNQWISGKYTELIDSTSTTPNKPETPNKPDDKKGTIILVNSVLKVTNPKGLEVWNSPDANNKLTGQVLAQNTSWKSTAQLNNGILWLKLGTNQWVKGFEASLNETEKPNKPETPNKPDDKKGTIILVNSVLKVTNPKGLEVWNSPDANNKLTGQKLAQNTSWKSTAQLNNGILWLKLGTNQWVKGFEASLNETTKPEKPNKPTDNPNTSGKILINKVAEINYKPGYGIAVWTSPNNGKVIKGKYLAHGTKWKVSAMLNNGILWYQVGTNQWIQAIYTK